MNLTAGTHLGPYQILSILGAGGMGEVYLAEDTRLDRKVALKLLPAQFTRDTDRVRRFMQEAKAASALNHPNIITIYDIGEAEAGHFMAMEFIEGRTLREMAGQPLSPEALAATGAQIAKALAVAHAAGITHRDIKPENIMLREDGYVKVLDFGLARLTPTEDALSEAETAAGTTAGTTPGMLVGTLRYMSPEQARGERVTPASDIFSLGLVCYELATGQHPFRADSMVGLLHSIISQPPLPPARVNPGLPAALDALILRMLAKEAGRRPTAGEVAEALQATGRWGDGATGGSQSPRRPAAPSPRHTVGREKERAELRSSFESVLRGRGLLLAVAGEPGIGKTTLVEDFLAELTAGWRCTMARGRCSERLAGTEAYLPLLEALESLLRSGQSIAQMMRQLAPTWYAQVVPLSGDSEESARLLNEVKAASQERMKRELAGFLQAVAQAQPLVIFFDDLHWADVSTIDLLSFLAGKFDALKALIVVTYRPSDLLLTRHPFLQIKPELQARGTDDIRLIDLARGNSSRFTFEPSWSAVWSPEGGRIAFGAAKDGSGNLYQKAVSGAGAEELLWKSEFLKFPLDWSRNGEYLLFGAITPQTKTDLWFLPMKGERKAQPFFQSPFDEWQATFSPDGHWVAYESDESGRPEVYVRAFPGAGGKAQVSTGGGGDPRWRPDGKELFYLSPDLKLMAVEVGTGAAFTLGAPRPLFETRVTGLIDFPTHYAVGADGQRFLINDETKEAATAPITVVLNWTEAKR